MGHGVQAKRCFSCYVVITEVGEVVGKRVFFVGAGVNDGAVGVWYKSVVLCMMFSVSCDMFDVSHGMFRVMCDMFVLQAWCIPLHPLLNQCSIPACATNGDGAYR